MELILILYDVINGNKRDMTLLSKVGNNKTSVDSKQNLSNPEKGEVEKGKRENKKEKKESTFCVSYGIYGSPWGRAVARPELALVSYVVVCQSEGEVCAYENRCGKVTHDFFSLHILDKCLC